jgi:hypothetical protein
MKWVTWNQAIIASVISIGIAYCVARLPSNPRRVFIISLSREFSLVSFLYTLWRLAMVLPLDQPAGALNRARSIDTLQHKLFLPLFLIHLELIIGKEEDI